MIIKKIRHVGKKQVFDIMVKDVNEYQLKNGVRSHNSGIVYSANQIFTITKATHKGDDGIEGFRFTLVSEKYRFVREKAKFPFNVMFSGGIDKWSSMFDLALEYGALIKPSMGWYQVVDMKTGEIIGPKRRAKDIEEDDAFFSNLVKEQGFKLFVENKYKIGASTSSEMKQDMDNLKQIEEDEEDN